MKNTAVERMFLAKSLFRQGVASCSKKQDHFEFSKGILSLQDAVELALGAVATKVDAQLKSKICFADYFKVINKKLATEPALPYERELLQLNDARIKIKHLGILQRPEDHKPAIGAVEPFLNFIATKYFGVEFERLSLADVVRKDDVRNLIKKAETQLSLKEMKECVITLAHAKFKLIGFHFIKGPLMRAFMGNADAEPLDWEKFDFGKDEIWLLEHGIDVTGYHRFNQILPEIGWDHKKKELVFWWEDSHSHEGNWTEPSLQWCIEFLIDMALKVESDNVYPKLIPDMEYFDFHLTSLKDDAVFWNYIKDEEFEERMRFRKTPIVPQAETFRLSKGQTIVGYASRQKDKPEWWFVISSQIPDKNGKAQGYGYVASADVEIRTVPKQAK